MTKTFPFGSTAAVASRGESSAGCGECSSGRIVKFCATLIHVGGIVSAGYPSPFGRRTAMWEERPYASALWT